MNCLLPLYPCPYHSVPFPQYHSKSDQMSVSRIWGLDLLMMNPAGVTTIRDHIRKNNLNITVHDGISPEPAKVKPQKNRVAPQSQNDIGADSKNTIFVLFWPKNPSN